MGPGEETGSETDGGRGGAAGSPRCRSPRGEGSGQDGPGLPSGAAAPRASPTCPGGGRSAGSARAARPHLTLADTVFLSLHEVSIPRAEELES